MQIIKHKWVSLSFSILLTVVSVYGIVVFGLQKGIDFTGGTLWQIEINESVSREELTDFFHKDLNITEAVITPDDNAGGFLIRAKEISEPLHQDYYRRLTEKFKTVTELGFQSIGATIGNELVTKAIWAFGINLFAIALYVAYAFRKVSKPISSWKYALITLITLFHDALIPVGLMAFLGKYLGVEIDTNFIVAVLLVIGFSVHDTIVVFDRIRENLRTDHIGGTFGDLVNRSINETFARSVNTSLTLIIVLVALFILGPLALKYFILSILVGTVVGTYSSIFVASPLLVLWRGKESK